MLCLFFPSCAECWPSSCPVRRPFCCVSSYLFRRTADPLSLRTTDPPVVSLLPFLFPFPGGPSCCVSSSLSRRTADPLIVSHPSFVCGPQTLFMSGPPTLLLCLFFPFLADHRPLCCVSSFLPARNVGPLLGRSADPLVVSLLTSSGGLLTLFPCGPPTLLLCLFFPSPL